MGGALEIKNEADLKKSWDNSSVDVWLASDGGERRIRVIRDDFNSYGELKNYLAHFLEKLEKKKDAFIEAYIS